MVGDERKTFDRMLDNLDKRIKVLESRKIVRKKAKKRRPAKPAPKKG